MKAAFPLISILINNYNYGQFLEEAINSALTQTYPNLEVIVVDDGSTDNSRSIIQKYNDRVISVLKENGGQASAFNAGFSASRGEWICFLDSDDVFISTKLEHISSLSTEHPSAGAIAHNLDYIDVTGHKMMFLPPDIPRQSLVDDRKNAIRGRLTIALPATSGLCIRRDLLKRLLPMPEEIRITADNYLKPAILAFAPVLLAPAVLAFQRIHGRNLYTVNEVKESSRIGQTKIAAITAYYLKERHPCLAPLCWRQFGRILYELRSPAASRERSEITLRYSVMNKTPRCLAYVTAAYLKASLRGLTSQDRRPVRRKA